MAPIQTVSVFLILLTSGLQYMVQRMNYKRDLARIEDVVGKARSAAWGNSLTPGQGQRKVRHWCHSAVRVLWLRGHDAFLVPSLSHDSRSK